MNFIGTKYIGERTLYLLEEHSIPCGHSFGGAKNKSEETMVKTSCCFFKNNLIEETNLLTKVMFYDRYSCSQKNAKRKLTNMFKVRLAALHSMPSCLSFSVPGSLCKTHNRREGDDFYFRVRTQHCCGRYYDQ